MPQTHTDRTESTLPPRSPILRLLSSYAGPDAPPRIYSRPREWILAAGTPPAKVPVGREVDPEAGVALPQDNLASGQHATLLLDPHGDVVIEDRKSKNGTWVNGARITRGPLRDGDVVQIGGSFLLLRWVDAARAAQDADLPELLGYSPAICALRHGLSEAARGAQRVLLLGETGTGKEVAARALHRLYGLPEDRLVSVNCAALPETLLESLLFGHERGAYSGAQTSIGFFRAAGGGTLLLDEVGDLPIALQPKLLRTIEDQKVTPIGTTQAIPVQFRLIAATNRDLRQACAAESFRLDLYMRLAQIKLHIAPLRERREDILPLAKHFMKGRTDLLTPAVVRRLLAHPFPGNVRELRNAAERLAESGCLDLEDMGAGPVPRAPGPGAKAPTLRQEEGDDPDDAVVRAPRRAEGRGHDAAARPAVTREVLEQALRETNGNVTETAGKLGRSPRQIERLAEKFGIRTHDFRGRRRRDPA